MAFGRITIDMYKYPELCKGNIDLMKVIRERDDVIGSLELKNIHVYVVQSEDELDSITVYQSAQSLRYATPCNVFKEFPLHIDRLEGSFDIQNESRKPKIILVDYEHRG